MITPTFKRERQLHKKGYKFIAGIDEVGRGPLAGPVVACAFVIKLNLNESKNTHPRLQKKEKNLPNPLYKGGNNKFIFSSLRKGRLRGGIGIRDSKQLTPLQREKFYEILTNDNQVDYGIGIVSEKIIDKINILQATFLAMKKAIENLKIKPNFLLIDGKWTLEDYPISQTAIPQGDKNIFSIAAASIIAKVTRDRMLIKFQKKYPGYGFEKHKGYGTRLHLEALKKYGPCKIHRRSFKPVKNLLKI